MRFCSLDGCNRPLWQAGLCQAHYWQRRRGQEFFEPGIRNKPSRIFHDGISWCIETLNYSYEPTGILRISEQDIYKVRNHRWCLYNNYGVTYLEGNIRISLHRFLLDAPDNTEVDHINQDRTDNRRENLEIVSQAENKRRHIEKRCADSPYRGVEQRPNGTFYARVKVNQIAHRKGPFKTKEEAAKIAKQMREDLLKPHPL